MKIQQLIEREPFGEILERTLSKFLKSHYGGDYSVHWYERYKSSDVSNGNKEQIWYCNPALNVIFTADAGADLLQSVREQYSHTPFPWRRLIQKNYVALATHPNLATWFTRSAIGISPPLPDSNQLLMVGGNNRIRLICPKKGWVYSILKDGFNPAYIKREVIVRQQNGDWPIPKLLGYDPDFTWFEESYVDGLALNRLSSDADQANVLKEAVSVLSRWLKCSQTEVKVLDYVEEVSEGIRNRIMSEAHTKWDKNEIILRQAQDDKHSVMVSLSNHDGQLGVFSGERPEILDWLKLISESVQSLVNKAGDTLQLALGHGDFQPGNILSDANQHLWLIDWEHSAKRQLLYDPLVYGLSTRFPEGLAGRVKTLVTTPRPFLGDTLCDAWPELDKLNPARLRLILLVFLLEELAWYIEENHNPLFRKQSGGWLALKEEFRPAIVFLTRD